MSRAGVRVIRVLGQVGNPITYQKIGLGLKNGKSNNPFPHDGWKRKARRLAEDLKRTARPPQILRNEKTAGGMP